ncbi:MAG: DNA mismatch repair protein MutS, partial [Alphaproteobacteria bacterium]|nr:DNA mismatch repair protein MutS [Alphaproteobacteria bacterium]
MNAPLPPGPDATPDATPKAVPNAVPDARGASPVMAQFFAAKAQAPDALVFFRMGDFYELFFEDAAKAAEALGIALTHRGVHAGQPIPMAGVPVHAAEAYLAKLIRSGFKVAVCEQMESPAAAKARGGKAVLRRDVVRVVTPGTLTEDSLLDARGANRLAAVAVRAGLLALASIDLSTGDVECCSAPPHELAALLGALRPAETLVPDRVLADPNLAAALDLAGGLVQPMAGALAEPAAAEARLKRLYGVATLDGFGGFQGAEVAALGLLGAHIEATQGGRTPLIKPPRRSGVSEVMLIDPATRASLEIERTLAGERQGTLLASLDRTVTGPGARLLAARLARPLTDPDRINDRLDAVEWWLERSRPRAALRETLKRAGDMARALSRLALGRGGPRDLDVLRHGLGVADALAGRLAAPESPLQSIPSAIADAVAALALGPELRALHDSLAAGLVEETPVLARDGGFVAERFSERLDEARALRDDSRKVAAALEARLSAESGTPLRIRHNGVLGYFLETSAKQAEPLLRPPLSGQFIHRQTLANQMRFTTTELIDLD